MISMDEMTSSVFFLGLFALVGWCYYVKERWGMIEADLSTQPSGDAVLREALEQAQYALTVACDETVNNETLHNYLSKATYDAGKILTAFPR